MSLSNLLRTITLGLISVLGVLILIDFVSWWHDWWHGVLNPDQVRPIENWALGLGLGMFYIQLAAAVETLLISLATRFRWIKLKQGRLIVGLFSLMLLSFALPLIKEGALDTSSKTESILQ